MADISAKEVMALRQKTGLSMMECKKALKETGGDQAAAEEALRVKLKGKMETRTDRAAGEGRIAIKVAGDGKRAAIVELRAETDFTAKNEKFQGAAEKIAELAVAQGPGTLEPTDEMNKIVDELRVSTGENISIARVETLSADADGNAYGTYIHHDGKTGVLLQGAGISEDMAKDVCMHITAAVPRPQGVTRDDVPESVIERERELAMAMAKEEGKNEEIAAKIVEGKVNKLYSELALLEQPFVKDPDKNIRDLLGSATVTTFRRWQIGEDA
jgi:elongation factor Ts